MKQISYSLLLITFLLPIQLYAQEGGVLELTMNDAMNLAVRNNVQTKNAQLDVLNQMAVNAEVTGRALPNINGKGEFNDYINPIQSFVPAEFIGGAPGTFVAVPFTPKFTSTASATGSQLLFDGSVLVALQARNTLLKLFVQKSKLTEEEIRYNINIAYNSLVIAYKQFEILKESIAYARDMANDMAVIYDNGMIEKVELDRTYVKLNNLVTDSLKTYSTLVVTEQMLKYQMGLPNDQAIQLIDTQINDLFLDAATLLNADMLYEDRTDYRLLQTQQLLNKYDLKRHKLSALPQLSIFGTAAYTYSTNNFNDVFSERYIFYSLVGVQLNVPIFDGMQRRNRVKQAKISILKTQNEIDNLELGIDFQKNQSKTILRNALLSMNNQLRNLDLARSVLVLTKTKYDAGVGSNLEVATAQTDFLAAQGNYFQAMIEVVKAQADLKKALGEF